MVRSQYTFCFLTSLALAGLAACGETKPSGSGASTATAAPALTAAPTATAAPTQTASAAPSTSATVASPPMPPRPLPIGSSGPIQPSAPADQQMATIAYVMAMVTPRGGDPPIVDRGYIGEISKKLESAVRTADKGKTPPNPVGIDKGGRKLIIQMGKGCTDKVPSNLLVQRSGSTLKAAYEAGVLVVACHDDKWECHQSTRDPADVLCHAAPR